MTDFVKGQRVRFTKWDKRMNIHLKRYEGKTGTIAFRGLDGKYMVGFGDLLSQHFWIGPSRLELSQ